MFGSRRSSLVYAAAAALLASASRSVAQSIPEVVFAGRYGVEASPIAYYGPKHDKSQEGWQREPKIHKSIIKKRARDKHAQKVNQKKQAKMKFHGKVKSKSSPRK